MVANGSQGDRGKKLEAHVFHVSMKQREGKGIEQRLSTLKAFHKWHSLSNKAITSKVLLTGG